MSAGHLRVVTAFEPRPSASRRVLTAIGSAAWGFLLRVWPAVLLLGAGLSGVSKADDSVAWLLSRCLLREADAAGASQLFHSLWTGVAAGGVLWTAPALLWAMGATGHLVYRWRPARRVIDEAAGAVKTCSSVAIHGTKALGTATLLGLRIAGRALAVPIRVSAAILWLAVSHFGTATAPVIRVTARVLWRAISVTGTAAVVPVRLMGRGVRWAAVVVATITATVLLAIGRMGWEALCLFLTGARFTATVAWRGTSTCAVLFSLAVRSVGSRLWGMVALTGSALAVPLRLALRGVWRASVIFASVVGAALRSAGLGGWQVLQAVLAAVAYGLALTWRVTTACGRGLGHGAGLVAFALLRVLFGAAFGLAVPLRLTAQGLWWALATAAAVTAGVLQTAGRMGSGVLQAALAGAGFATAVLWRGTAGCVLVLGIAAGSIARHLWGPMVTAASALALPVQLAARGLWWAVAQLADGFAAAVLLTARLLGRGARAGGNAIAVLGSLLWQAGKAAFVPVKATGMVFWQVLSTAFVLGAVPVRLLGRGLWWAITNCAVALGAVLVLGGRSLMAGAALGADGLRFLAECLLAVGLALARPLWSLLGLAGLGIAVQTRATAALTRGVSLLLLSCLRFGIALLIIWPAQAAAAAIRWLLTGLLLLLRANWTGLIVLGRLLAMAFRAVRHSGDISAMANPGFTRSQLLSLVSLLWIAGAALAFVWPVIEPRVTVVHWANGHLTSASLLPAFAKEFNEARHRTSAGALIEVKVEGANSGAIACQLIRRINQALPCDDNEGTYGEHGDALSNPTIVTPVTDHWLHYVNHELGRPVIDTAETKPLAITWVGIVTETAMAQCLGWPRQEIGIADILALRNDPRGWEACPGARPEWGKLPRISFTDPNSSSTGRSLLFTHYSLAAGKPPEQLTPADIARPEVAEYVRNFQRAVDHYVPDTLILNSKIAMGARFGHFYFVAEDNLVKLEQGKVKVTEGATSKAKRLERDMVFIYPKEGSTPHNYPAGIVQADWVRPEQAEAARRWVAYVREDRQQQAFMQEGFRPATNIPYVKPEGSRFIPDPSKPAVVLDANRMNPAAGEAAVESWGAVKKPGIATFVMDISGSMSGNKLERAKDGVISALSAINAAHGENRVGLLAFSDQIKHRHEIEPVSKNGFPIAEAVKSFRAGGETALYQAIREGVRMTDEAPGPEDAIRGVVVLTDGHANMGPRLDSLVKMMSTEERVIRECSGMQGENECLDVNGNRVPKGNLIGTELAFPTRHRVLIFFVGIGDADYQVGKVIAEATGSAFRGVTEEDLSRVLEQYGKYF